MSSIDPASLRLDRTHCRAICDEVGERLRIILARGAEMPPQLRRLVARLDELDRVTSPSIVPTFEDLLVSAGLTSKPATTTS
jgi:hypothetical protein